MDCLVLACSPRKNGNSDIIAHWIMDELEKNDIRAEIIFLRDYTFTSCIECNACFKDGSCHIRDDMQIFYPKLLQAKKIIIVSPVFFYSYGGKAKSFIDRLQCFWAKKFILKEHVIVDEAFRKERQTISFFCGGTDFSDTFFCIEKITKNFNLFIESQYIRSYNFPAIDDAGDIKKDPRHMSLIIKAVDEFL